jgi:membrane dipeptidase
MHLEKENSIGFHPGMMVIDAHAHPDMLKTSTYYDETSTLEKVRQLGMNASCFAAVGDRYRRNAPALPVSYEGLLAQLDKVRGLEEQGQVKIVRNHSELPQDANLSDFAPGAILAMEGAAPLGEDIDKINELYDIGVRIITPLHYVIDNPIGDIMNGPSHNGGLTKFGRQIVGQAMSSGIVVDVAHAHMNTLKGIVEISRANGLPIIDSHTSPTPAENPEGNRFRTWREMEMIAETGGVICTFAVWWKTDQYQRTTFLDWAKENLEIAKRFGTDHVGLGTDGGGVKGMTTLIDGFDSILDLPKLAEAMFEVGFKRNEIAAYMGGNIERVLQKCIG